ncbi:MULTISPECIES: tail fiber assembly protein [Enterobacter cloacae complex]|uniref:tail fiber assembly protein n=1 Tax=Enterobacter cloacae complex TaxID=354276 RepID=UPI000D3E45D7|nr:MULTISPECIES: tail fiber assembly protein [Enterobacter cloacae complex]AWC84848.1 tail fiber assembly protein [Enterobacter cloacae complex sp. FDA-CDC-AR_0164]
MKIFKNFTSYLPKADDLPENVLFLLSAEGMDWYEAQKEFSENSLKIMFDSDGVICCAEMDASRLWPINCSVAEIESKNLPDSFEVGAGKWIFDGKKITARELSQDEIETRAQAQKTRLMNAATTAISTLQDSVDLGMATAEENALLPVWKIYRVLLNRVDVTAAPDIDWPEVPGNVA